MNIKDLPQRCELVNRRNGHLLKFALSPVCKFATISKKILRSVFDSRAAWVGKDSGRAVKRGLVVGHKKLSALCAALFVFVSFSSFSDSVSDSLDRIDNSISNLSAKVDALADAIQGMNSNGGVVVAGAQDVDYYLEMMSDRLSGIQSLLGTSRIGLGRDVQTMRVSLMAIQNTLLPQLLANSTSISNSLDQIASKLSGDYNMDDIWYMLNDIDGEIYYIADLISDLGLFIREWGVANTNLLSAILEKINDLADTINYGGDSGGGAAVGVRVEGGTVNVGEVNLNMDDTGLWDYSWSLAVSYLHYLQSVAGEDQWDSVFIQSESESISETGSDYRSGVMAGFQSLMSINSQILENNHRLLLFLNQSADLDDIKYDLNHQLDVGANETEASGADVEYSVHYISEAWSDFHSSLKYKINETFDTSGFDISSAPHALLSFSGGSIMGFQYETFTFDFSDTLSDSFAEIIRSWMLFFYSATCIFIVLRLIPFGMIRFAGLMFMLFNINKNLQK